MPRRRFTPDIAPDPILVLSFDGGGIRGYLQARLLAYLQEKLLSNAPLTNFFDVFGGASTGGIVALGLTTPRPGGSEPLTAAEIAGFYREHGPDIFPQPKALWRRGRAWVHSKYGRAALDDALASTFGDVRLSAALARTIVPAYNLTDHELTWFDSALARRPQRQAASGWRTASSREVDTPGLDGLSDRDAWLRLAPRPDQEDQLVRHVAAATSAAPTYLPPATFGNPRKQWLDGGLAINNPSPVLMGFAHRELFARRWELYSNDRWESVHSFPKITVLSIGTGSSPPRSSVARAGRLGFAFSVPAAFMYPAALAAEFSAQAMTLLEEVAYDNNRGDIFRVIRIEPTWGHGGVALDDSSPSAFDKMDAEAKRIISRLDRHTCRNLVGVLQERKRKTALRDT